MPDLPEHNPENAQRFTDLHIAKLLTTVEVGHVGMIKPDDAARLLKSVIKTEEGLYKVPVAALLKANSTLQHWEEAAERGLIEKITNDGKPYFAIVLEVVIHDIPVEITFMQRLEIIAGMTHDAALAALEKYKPATDKRRLH